MGRVNDIGAYFDQLVKRGKGGRRLDDDQPRAPRSPERPAKRPTTRPRATADRVRDVIAKGKDVLGRARSGGGSRSKPATKVRPPDSLVTVEYTPAIDGDPDPGDVVWAWVPYEEDPSQGKDRPIVVIGRRGDALVGIPLTTKRHDDEAQVDVGTGDWDSKRRTSYARVWRLMEVDPAEMRREGAVLERAPFDRLIEAVDQYYDIKRVETTTGSARRRRTTTADDDF